MVYLLLKLIHVLLAVITVGFVASFGLWLGRTATAPRDAQQFALSVIRFIDSRYVNAGLVGLLITGIGIAQMAKIPMKTPWITITFVLLTALFGVAHGMFAPAVRKQLALIQADRVADASFASLAAKARLGALLMFLLSIGITVLMVWKPVI